MQTITQELRDIMKSVQEHAESDKEIFFRMQKIKDIDLLNNQIIFMNETVAIWNINEEKNITVVYNKNPNTIFFRTSEYFKENFTMHRNYFEKQEDTIMKAKGVKNEDLIRSYLKQNHPNSTVVIIHLHNELPETIDVIRKLNVEIGEFSDICDCEFLAIDFGDDEGGACDLCHKIPDSQPYTTVWINESCEYENT